MKKRKATTGEKIAAKWEDISVAELRKDDYGSSYTLAKRIDSALRREMRRLAPEVTRAIQSIERCAVVGKCSICEGTKNRIREKYGVELK